MFELSLLGGEGADLWETAVPAVSPAVAAAAAWAPGRNEGGGLATPQPRVPQPMATPTLERLQHVSVTYQNRFTRTSAWDSVPERSRRRNMPSSESVSQSPST